MLKVFLLVAVVFLLPTITGAQEFTKTKVAVMDFQLQGKGFESPDTGAIVTEWFINGLVKEGRFDVVERHMLQKMMKEQEIAIAATGDPSNAVRMGERLGVKIVITGYVVQYQDKMEVNARLIDVKTSSIIAAENVKERGHVPLETLVARLVQKVIRDFPVEGYIVDRDKNKVSIDLGEKAGVKVGMRFFAYKEGKTVKHPRTGQVLDVEPIQTGVLKIEVVRGKISDAIIVEENEPGVIAYGQLVKSEIPLDDGEEGKVYVNTDPDSGKVRVLNIKGPYGVVDADRLQKSDVHKPSEGFGEIEEKDEKQTPKPQVQFQKQVEKPGTLMVNTSPFNARTRILNISPAFSQGMQLEAGRYQVEVSAAGYETHTAWVDLEAGEEKAISISLLKIPVVQAQTQATAITQKKTIAKHKKYARLLAKIRSKNPQQQILAAKKITRGGIRDREVLAAVEKELLAGCQQRTRDKFFVDAMSWFCKALGASGQSQYKATLQEVAKGASTRKLKGYANKALLVLP